MIERNGVLFVNYNEKLSKKNLERFWKKGGHTIQHLSTGHDNVDKDWVKHYSLKQKWLPDYSSDSVADLTISLIIDLYRKTQRPTKAKHKHYFVYSKKAKELKNKQALVIGSEGAIGKKVCKRLKAFGCKILGFDLKNKNSLLLLDAYLAKANIIVLCLNGENNKNFFNWGFFKSLKNRPILVNIVRKELVKEINVRKALKKGLISGYAVDDEIWNPDLKKHPNVIYTEHVGARTIEAQERKTKLLRKQK